MIRHHPFLFSLILVVLFLITVLTVHIGYLYKEVGKGITAEDGNYPTIFYGRSLEIRKGDHIGNIHIADRLNRLSYRRITGKPTTTGTFSLDEQHLQIFPRPGSMVRNAAGNGPVDVTLSGNQVISLSSFSGDKMDYYTLDREEIGRILSSKLGSRHQVTLDNISPHLQKAVIACEDKRFYSHPGIDIFAIIRALAINLKEQRFAQGGSTITQQVAKNFFLSPRKTIGRKLREAEMAIALELRYSKRQILEMYFNKIYLGQTGIERIYGVEDAASVYFSKRAKDLSLTEAALLAGIIQAPNRYLLFKNPKTAKDRRNKILGHMRKLKMIAEDDYQQASNSPVKLLSGAVPVHLTSFFIDYIQRTTREELGSEKFYHTGYRYYTTLDPLLQSIAEESLTRGLEEIENRAIPAKEPLQAALVAVDPKTGELVAMVGGRNYAQTRFNRAVDAKRQPGSAFKPFVLMAALSQSLAGKGKWTLSTLISGEPITLPTPEGPWTPSNFEDKQYGNITIRKAIEDSVNTATVRLANDVGFEEILGTARQAGVKSPLRPVPSMALGSFEMTPMEIAYAFATFASGGVRYEPFSLSSVTTVDGDPLITRVVKQKQVFDPRVAYLAGNALEGVLVRGTAKESRSLKINFPLSGKTGTTNGNRDSWFVSYTPDIVCAVWVGYDGGSDTGLTGAAGALRINARFLRAFYSNSRPQAVAVPAGIEKILIDPVSGFLATAKCPQTFEESYLAGTAPKESCPNHPVNPIMDVIRDKVKDAGSFFRKLFE